MTANVSTHTLQEMKEYYRARADEYDQWFYRQGRYDKGPELNQLWHSEAESVFEGLARANLTGDILELAPGTGIWTERLAQTASHITAVDASPEMVEINRARLHNLGQESKVEYQLADLFEWQPNKQYDGVFFGFWLSHVPFERQTEFFAKVSAALKPGGQIFFVDSRREPTSTAADHILPEQGNQVMTRKLNDGQAYQIVKNFYEPAALTAQLAGVGLSVQVRETPYYFIYGLGRRD